MSFSLDLFCEVPFTRSRVDSHVVYVGESYLLAYGTLAMSYLSIADTEILMLDDSPLTFSTASEVIDTLLPIRLLIFTTSI